MSAKAYSHGLEKNAANHVPLTPLTFLDRTADVYPDRTAIIHGDFRQTWAETRERCYRLASALVQLGIEPGDTVSIIAPNTPAMLEAHFGVPLSGAVLNAVNCRLDADGVAFILRHGECKLLLVDREFAPLVEKALQSVPNSPRVIDINDHEAPDGTAIGETDYESLLASGDPAFAGCHPVDEWTPIALNYTSGTTGDPKGVVPSHRGTYLMSLVQMTNWPLPRAPIYLWTLPMFHANGWCFTWAITAAAGTHVCLRKVNAANVLSAIAKHGVDHFCAAPIVLSGIASMHQSEWQPLPRRVRVLTAGSPAPAAVLEAVGAMGFDVDHVFGITEISGTPISCAWHDEWDALPAEQQGKLKARQGVRAAAFEKMSVADLATLEPVPADSKSSGEVLVQGNTVMMGYLKNPEATAKAFDGGWFHTGDIAVVHPDGYIQITDRSKDVIISGGENISSVEVEEVIYRMSGVLNAAVVAQPDDKWGETPCAFIELKADAPSITEEDVISFCRQRLAHFKCPRRVVFGELPKTATGKIQKFRLREQAGSRVAITRLAQ
ncbi:AMP-binding protein [Paraburkholderia rhynchosiae]|uniref:Acyl-CoA synthetase n=1 Tax=Paraburkholderia rhynchosiae TaxID=487049 RepID=A0A2N7W6W1_9BURK|nr:AMP-binding protein [Paraburkholderia rhynchosiae]PMS25139.1 acyl-CoA synthetase [Paraburkholderia rhynchosiae]CAB3714769.1 Long-chain-fatty-acid--CoA ligase [Paraburkholderia rhynchosiae]